MAAACSALVRLDRLAKAHLPLAAAGTAAGSGVAAGSSVGAATPGWPSSPEDDTGSLEEAVPFFTPYQALVPALMTAGPMTQPSRNSSSPAAASRPTRRTQKPAVWPKAVR